MEKSLSQISNKNISNRYRIIERQITGNSGQVFTAKDELKNKNVILKINHSQCAHYDEAKIMKLLNETGNKNFPKLIEEGRLNGRSVLVIEMLGKTLFDYQNKQYNFLRKRYERFTFKTSM